jgi:hypothetical protein
MLLRRITKHVTDQNWFAVFIDFLIVVVGVFIGIQVANWNDALKAKQAEKVYLQRMHEDIEFAQELANELLPRRIQGFQSSLNMVRLMDGDGVELSDEYVDCDFPSAISIQIDLPFLNTIGELLETGNINVLTDDALRIAVLELQNRSELLRRFQDQTSVQIINITDVFAGAIKLRTQSKQNSEIRLQRQCNLKALHANNRFINAISLNIDLTDAFINNRLIPWSKQINELHHLIDQSLKINHGE